MNILYRSITAVLLTLSVLLMGGCDILQPAFEDVTGRTHEEFTADVLADATADMVALGVDPALATPDMWRDYLRMSAEELMTEAWMSWDIAQEEATSPIEKIIGASLPQGALIVGLWQLAKGMLVSRGRQNMLGIIKAPGKDKIAALMAVAFDSHTPDSVKYNGRRMGHISSLPPEDPTVVDPEPII